MPKGYSKNPEVTRAKRQALMRGNTYALGRTRPPEERAAIGAAKLRPLADRLWDKVEKSDTCWIFTGYLNKSGYGVIGIEHDRAKGTSRTGLAHRVAYELEVGPIPEK